ncbi:MAG: ABC transporter ATP-binding protein [Rhodobacteraceae bacterium]|nr:MAG: ABC transporter ATP-binding protein [Paracoccaceae bacterium]
MSPALSVNGLTVTLGRHQAAPKVIDDLSFDVGPGEILGMVGESGAGKSLTGQAILGLLDPPLHMAGGRIEVAGERIDGLSETAMRSWRGRRIGAVFQDPMTSLNPLLTIGRQLTETIRTHLPMNAASARERAIRLLSEVGVPAPEERMGAYPHMLSGGMRQRVVLALAFACDPMLVIADEPTTALDVSIQAQIVGLLRRMCRERGASVMLITHDMGVIAECADRVAVLYGGRLAEIGPADTLLREPAHPYTQGLMASIPDMRRRVDMLPQIPGSMPRVGGAPSGCAFHPRCSRATARCRAERPDLVGHGSCLAACWMPGDPSGFRPEATHAG